MKLELHEHNVSEKLWQIAIETTHRHLPMGMSSAANKQKRCAYEIAIRVTCLPEVYNGGSHSRPEQF